MARVKWLPDNDPFGFGELSRYHRVLLMAVILVFGVNILLSDWLMQSPRAVFADGLATLLLTGLLITGKVKANTDREK